MVNGESANGRTADSEADWAFSAAYVFVALVDARLRGKQHLRGCKGEAIFTLDELLVAIDDGRWPGPDAAEMAGAL